MTSPSTNRRGFLKMSAAGTVALSGLSLARSAHAAGDEVIKIGMIGCGGRCSGAAAESLKAAPNVKLVAMTDVFEERVQDSRQRLKELAPTRWSWTTITASTAWTATRTSSKAPTWC
jgi:myo-inositol 2-dehydrogenase / D-chiro-inositol 1-dehydrogenase